MSGFGATLLSFFLIVCNGYSWTSDLYDPIHNAFDAGKSITRASGRGLSPEN
jgi:hypothetical protein